MGQADYDSSEEARSLFQRANDVLGYDLSEVCFSGPAEKLNATAYSQPALFVTSYIALQEFRKKDPATVDRCDGAAGLSLGEYTALAFAGALDHS